MQEDSRLPGTRRPGGRTARTRTAVFEAATAELAEKGYAGTSLDRIASRAGVAQSTVYRRWGTLQLLIQELVGDFTVEMADLTTGTLQGDLAEAARAIVALYRHPVHRFWMDAMVAAAVHDEAARRTLSGVIASRIQHVAESLAPAAEREQAPPGTDLREAVRMLAAPFYYRMYISGEPLTDDLVHQGAAAVTAAIRSGALVPAP